MARPRSMPIRTLAGCGEPPQPGCRSGALSVGIATQLVSAEFRIVLRSRRLVSPPTLPLAVAAGMGGSDFRGRAARPPFHQGRDHPVSRRVVHSLHVLPRRTCAPTARTGRVDGLLPDDLRGRSFGGIFVGLIAPRIFNEYLELPIGVLGSMLLAVWLLYRFPARRVLRLGAATAIATVVAVMLPDASPRHNVRLRNFYGILQVSELGAADAVYGRCSTARYNTECNS